MSGDEIAMAVANLAKTRAVSTDHQEEPQLPKLAPLSDTGASGHFGPPSALVYSRAGTIQPVRNGRVDSAGNNQSMHILYKCAADLPMKSLTHGTVWVEINPLFIVRGLRRMLTSPGQWKGAEIYMTTGPGPATLTATSETSAVHQVRPNNSSPPDWVRSDDVIIPLKEEGNLYLLDIDSSAVNSTGHSTFTSDAVMKAIRDQVVNSFSSISTISELSNLADTVLTASYGNRTPQDTQEMQDRFTHEALMHCPIWVARQILGRPKERLHDDFDCEVCAENGLQRAPSSRGDASSKGQRPCDVMHLDSSPAGVTGRGGERHVYAAICDSTRLVYGECTTRQLTPVKLKVIDNLRAWVLRTGKGHFSVKKIFSDNEFNITEVTDHLKTHNIDYEFTAPHSSWMNGLIEALFKPLWKAVRCSLRHAGISNKYWPDAAQHFLDCFNDMPNSFNRSKGSHHCLSPNEKASGLNRAWKTFARFGSPCYVFIEGKRNKLKARGELGMFLGFSADSRAIKVLVRSGLVRLTRHFRLFERDQRVALPAFIQRCDKLEDITNIGVINQGGLVQVADDDDLDWMLQFARSLIPAPPRVVSAKVPLPPPRGCTGLPNISDRPNVFIVFDFFCSIGFATVGMAGAIAWASRAKDCERAGVAATFHGPLLAGSPESMLPAPTIMRFGCDIRPHPEYPGTFIQCDAIEFIATHLDWLNHSNRLIVWGSPGCQPSSSLANFHPTQAFRSRDEDLLPQCEHIWDTKLTGTRLLENVGGSQSQRLQRMRDATRIDMGDLGLQMLRVRVIAAWPKPVPPIPDPGRYPKMHTGMFTQPGTPVPLPPGMIQKYGFTGTYSTKWPPSELPKMKKAFLGRSDYPCSYAPDMTQGIPPRLAFYSLAAVLVDNAQAAVTAARAFIPPLPTPGPPLICSPTPPAVPTVEVISGARPPSGRHSRVSYSGGVERSGFPQYESTEPGLVIRVDNDADSELRSSEEPTRGVQPEDNGSATASNEPLTSPSDIPRNTQPNNNHEGTDKEPSDSVDDNPSLPVTTAPVQGRRGYKLCKGCGAEQHAAKAKCTACGHQMTKPASADHQVPDGTSRAGPRQAQQGPEPPNDNADFERDEPEPAALGERTIPTSGYHDGSTIYGRQRAREEGNRQSRPPLRFRAGRANSLTETDPGLTPIGTDEQLLASVTFGSEDVGSPDQSVIENGIDSDLYQSVANVDYTHENATTGHDESEQLSVDNPGVPEPTTSERMTELQEAFMEANALALAQEWSIDPKNFKEAMRSMHRHHWEAAMTEEMKSQILLGALELCLRQKHQKVIGSTWVYKTKRHKDNTIQRFKARLCGRGFAQVLGVNYLHTYSPTAHHATMRVGLALSAEKGWSKRLLDVSTAFLNADADTEILMELPEGFFSKQEREKWVIHTYTPTWP